MNAARAGSLDSVKYLVSKGADVEQVGFEETSLLHYAAASPSVEIVNYVLSSCLDVNRANRDDETPLMFACRLGRVENVVALLAANADLAMVDRQGLNAVHHAKKYPEIIALLQAVK